MSIEPFERLINVFKIKTSIDYSVDVEEIEKLDVRHSEILPQNDPAVEDHENTINNLENVADKKHLSHEFKFNSDAKTLNLRFFTEQAEWTLTSISGHCHNIRKMGVTIPDNLFDKYDSNEPMIIEDSEISTNNGIIEHSRLEAIRMLNLGRIERHPFMNDFTIKIVYKFNDDERQFISEYEFKILFHTEFTRICKAKLPHFKTTDSIADLYNVNFKRHISSLTEENLKILDQLESLRDTSPKSFEDHAKKMKFALEIEDLQETREYEEKFSRKNVSFLYRLKRDLGKYFKCEYFIEFRTHELPQKYEKVSLGLVPMTKYIAGQKVHFHAQDCRYVKIDGVGKGVVMFTVKILKNKFETEDLLLKQPYYVFFEPNRQHFRAGMNAIQEIEKRGLQHYFFNFATLCGYSRNATAEKINGLKIQRWFNEKISTNAEQIQAITNIVNRTAYPFPYVVHGPPGTGKTSLIVEAIMQILEVNPKAKILVTAQSNSACDEVGERLLKYMSINKIYRFYSPSLAASWSSCSEALLESSNLSTGGKNCEPSIEELQSFNVIIVTLSSSFQLHAFTSIDFIFVDECAAATEPEALVPIVHFSTQQYSITANIVLLGDHKQLGPVIKSNFASSLGLNVSLMEHVLKCENHRMNPITKKYNEKYVTQLLDNFRSHPAILQFSNVLFYHSKLRAKVEEPERSLGTNWNYITNAEFPVIFHHCDTPHRTMYDSTSSYNLGEINIVKDYMHELRKSSIGDEVGIISPYSGQIKELKVSLGVFKRLGKVEIGTSEYFQGREMRVIILSTVKSRGSVGFLDNARRLNVCLTRAKSLLIVIGNADTLQLDKMWKLFIHYCKSNNSTYGKAFTLSDLNEIEKKQLELLNSPNLSSVDLTAIPDSPEYSFVYIYQPPKFPEFHDTTDPADSFSPSYAPISPMYAPTSPMYSRISPTYAPISPMYAPTSPMYSTISPTYAPISPYYNPSSHVYSSPISPIHSSTSAYASYDYATRSAVSECVTENENESEASGATRMKLELGKV